MGFILAFVVVLVHVLAGTYHWFAGAAYAAIRQWRQLGTPGTPHLGSCRRQLVADGTVLVADCYWHEAPVCLGHHSAGPNEACAVHGALRCGQDPLLPEHAIFSGARSVLLCWLGNSLLFPQA